MTIDWKLPWSASCLCGQVRMRITQAPWVSMACHCRACQKLTGGAYSLTLLSRAFAQIAEELRKQYAISYYPTNHAQDGSYRRVKVRISPTSQYQNLIVRARDGYRAGSKNKQQDAELKRGKRPGLKRRDQEKSN